jgi:hypothetical protein
MPLFNVRYMDEPADRSTGEVEEVEEADEQETSKEMKVHSLGTVPSGNLT